MDQAGLKLIDILLPLLGIKGMYHHYPAPLNPLRGPKISLTHTSSFPYEPSEIGGSLYFPQTSKKEGTISLQHLGEVAAKGPRE